MGICIRFRTDDIKGVLISKNLVPNELYMVIVSNYIQTLLGLHCLETRIYVSGAFNSSRTPLDFVSWAGRLLLSNH